MAPAFSRKHLRATRARTEAGSRGQAYCDVHLRTRSFRSPHALLPLSHVVNYSRKYAPAAQVKCILPDKAVPVAALAAAIEEET